MTRTSWVLIIAMTFLSVFTQAATVQASGIAKIKAIVVDESGTPISDAHLNVRFSSDSGTVKGMTDGNGIFEVKAISDDGVILGDIKKDGYYDSGLAHSFYRTRFGLWQPWGKELTVVMRPIVNPVPMYVIDKFFKLPMVGEAIGFDLEKADWVIPHGLGTHADFIFKIERRYSDGDNYDATMTLTFSNPFDGIQIIKDDGGGDFNVGSNFRLPRIAPADGYQVTIQKRTSCGTYGWHSDNFDDNNYIFRIRSEVDDDGNLKRAMYGKIRGDFQFSPLSFLVGLDYYLNPDYTRNLEFDYKQNLFK